MAQQEPFIAERKQAAYELKQAKRKTAYRVAMHKKTRGLTPRSNEKSYDPKERRREELKPSTAWPDGQKGKYQWPSPTSGSQGSPKKATKKSAKRKSDLARMVAARDTRSVAQLKSDIERLKIRMAERKRIEAKHNKLKKERKPFLDKAKKSGKVKR